MELDGLRIHFHDFDESLDRFVGLLVQQEVEPFSYTTEAHAIRTICLMSRGHQCEKERQGEKPPISRSTAPAAVSSEVGRGG